LHDLVADVQAAFTQLAAVSPSPRSWDLYLVIHVNKHVTDPVDELLLDEISADTRYVRKIVRTAIDFADERSVDRALRPLLPLLPSPQFDLDEPLDALRRELRALRAPTDLIESAIGSFLASEEVSLR
jgi:hypothetical protein